MILKDIKTLTWKEVREIQKLLKPFFAALRACHVQGENDSQAGLRIYEQFADTDIIVDLMAYLYEEEGKTRADIKTDLGNMLYTEFIEKKAAIQDFFDIGLNVIMEDSQMFSRAAQERISKE